MPVPVAVILMVWGCGVCAHRRCEFVRMVCDVRSMLPEGDVTL